MFERDGQRRVSRQRVHESCGARIAQSEHTARQLDRVARAKRRQIRLGSLELPVEGSSHVEQSSAHRNREDVHRVSLQLDLGAASGMAPEVDGDRQPRDMRRANLDIDGKRGRAAAKSLGPDAQPVDASQ